MEETLNPVARYHIAIVEDDPKIANLLLRQLNRYGYRVEIIQDFQHVDERVKERNPDLILLDINLPYYDGFYWCRVIRRFSTVPIVFVSSRDGETDQVFALENGGDEYITKPFQPDVVIAKLKALLRRTYGEYIQVEKEPPNLYLSGPLTLDTRKALISRGEVTRSLSKTELELLRKLLEAKGNVVSRNALLETLWDDTSFVDDNTLTVNVTRLRHKLASIGIIDAIVTIRGLGYRLVIGDPSNASNASDPSNAFDPLHSSDPLDGSDKTSTDVHDK